MTSNHQSTEQKVCFVYVPCANMDEAKNLAHQSIEKKYAACANILPAMTSIFLWKGQIQEAQEVVLILKTLSDQVEKLEAMIKTLHSYEVPCIAVLPVADINQAFHEYLQTALNSQ